MDTSVASTAVERSARKRRAALVRGKSLVRKTGSDTREVEAQRQFEYFRQAATSWNLSPLRNERGAFAASKTEWWSSRLHFRESHSAGHIGWPGNTLRRKIEALNIVIQDRGFAQTVIGDKVSARKSGDIEAYAGDVPMFLVKNLSARQVSIPYELIGFDPNHHVDQQIFAQGVLANRLLSSAISIAFHEIDEVPADQAHLVEDAFCGLVRSLVLKQNQSDEGQTALRRARAHAMRVYIDEHLTAPGLDLGMVAGAFNVSSATVKRDFAEDGGVGRYIWRRRLARAYLQLIAAPPSRGLIAQVADTWMFSDEWSFRRAFRREFGVGPGDIVSVETSWA